MTTAIVEWALSWLWQGCLLTLVVAGALRLTTRASATTRFLAWWATLAAVLILGMAPLTGTLEVLVPDGPTSGDVHLGLPATGSNDGVDAVATRLFPLTVPAVPTWLGFSLIGGWCGFVGVRACRLAVSLQRLRSVKQSTESLPDDIERHLPLWQQMRAHGRPTELRLSARVATAAMLGLGSPVIALPPRLVDSISRADLDRVVIHEYAHVQRRDDWSIIGQALIDAAVGWHPAIWWIGRQLHLEREVASDDWVAHHTSTPCEYAACLARVAELALHHRQIPHAASAIRSRRELSGRVERLLSPDRNMTVRPARLALTTATVTLAGAVWLLGHAPPLVRSVAVDPSRPVLAGAHVATPQLLAAPPLLAAPKLLATPPLVTARLRAAQQVGRPLTMTMTTIPDVLARSVASGPAKPAGADRPAARQIPASSLALGANVRPPQPTTHFKSPLLSTQLRVDGRISALHAETRTHGLLAGSARASDESHSPWTQVANVGKAVGAGVTEAGQATASAFQVLGSRLTRVFGGD